MIVSFKHKGLQEVFEKGKSSRLPQERIAKLKRILAVLDAATDIKDFSNPAFRPHLLKKPPLNGFWSIDVNGNFRIVFQFDQGMVSDLDYLDTH